MNIDGAWTLKDPAPEARRCAGAALLLAMVLVPSASALDVNDRFRIDFHITAGVMMGEWSRFDPPRGGTGPLVAEASLGIPEDGIVADQWFLAGRGTYRWRERDALVVQLSHRRFADSTLTDAEDAIELDWLFYEHRFGDKTSLRVGRTPVAFGLLNEVRDEGVDLPFFRAPFVFYDEGGFITETVDGVRFRHTFGKDPGWGLTVEAYGGQWELLEMAGAVNRLAGTVQGVATSVEKVDAKDGYGWALWAHTPKGVRMGGGGQRFSTTGGSFSRLPGDETDWEHEFLSFEVDTPGFLLQAEGRQARFPANFTTAAIGLPLADDPGAGFLTEIETEAWYVLAGIRFLDHWGLFAKIERGGQLLQCFVLADLRCDRLDQDQIFHLSKPHGERTWVDAGVALRYEMKKGLVFRAEYHRIDGMALRRDFVPFGIVLTREDPEEDGKYGLVSVSWRL